MVRSIVSRYLDRKVPVAEISGIHMLRIMRASVGTYAMSPVDHQIEGNVSSALYLAEILFSYRSSRVLGPSRFCKVQVNAMVLTLNCLT
jgi:hypothetical protein